MVCRHVGREPNVGGRRHNGHMTERRLPAGLVPGDPVSPARAKTLGLTWHTLNHSPLFLKVVRGLYTPRPTRPEDEYAARVRAAVAAAGPHARAGGLTGLALMGVPVPRRLAGPDLEIVVPQATTKRPAGQGLRLRRHGQAEPPWRICHGVPVAAPPVCWLQAADTATVEELIMLGDGLTRRHRPVTTVSDLAAYLNDHPHTPGIAKARAALFHVCPGTDSLRETATRLLLTCAGLPQPTVNLKVLTSDGPKYLDLAYEEGLIALEYDGRQHGLAEALDYDARRRRALEDLGWRIITITDHDLWRGPDSVLRSVTLALADRAPHLLRPGQATSPASGRAIMARLFPPA